MHFRRSLAGVALLGVFAAMAFAGAATGAPAQSEQSLATVVPGSVSGTSLQLDKMGVGRMSAVAGKPVEKNPYKAIVQSVAKAKLVAGSTARSLPKAPRTGALSYKAPAGLNATAVATQDQPIAEMSVPFPSVAQVEHNPEHEKLTEEERTAFAMTCRCCS